MKDAKNRGDRGEAEVARYLRGRKYTLLESQWRCRFGEIDLVAKSPEGCLCFVEVKLRSRFDVGLPREFVDARKQQKLRTAAELYLSLHEWNGPVRFDVAEVYEYSNPRRAEITYIPNAFE